MLMVVRHADAGDKLQLDRSGQRRPLSASGRRQADGLVVRLEDYPVERVLSSPTLRCLDTVRPLARDRFLEVEPVARLEVDGGLDPAAGHALGPGAAQRRALHPWRDFIGRLVNGLVEDGFDVKGPLRWPRAPPGCSSGATTGDARSVAACWAPWRLDDRVPTR